tara:strand:+ start:2318 stop:2602 length:285 start_codon:yes stop_codon:yes gene_type:complete
MSKDVRVADLTKLERVTLTARQNAYMVDKLILCIVSSITLSDSGNSEGAKEWLNNSIAGYDEDWPESPEKVQDWYNSKMGGREFPTPRDIKGKL